MLYLAKSCSNLKQLDPTAESGIYVIDPDGEGGFPPLHDVTCDMTDKNGIGITVISHDSENKTLVDGCNPPGCYSRDIRYTGASLSQLAGLTRVSSQCEQFIKYECYFSRLFSKQNGTQFGWWVSRNSTKMTYWGGASPDSGKCACGMNNTCANRNRGCNCDMNDNVTGEDSGLLTDKEQLPVIQLRFGDVGITRRLNKTVKYDEKGYHTLEKLKCFGIP